MHNEYIQFSWFHTQLVTPFPIELVYSMSSCASVLAGSSAFGLPPRRLIARGDALLPI